MSASGKKELHLIRHAKSSWDNPALADIERPLNTRGEKARSKMAPHILKAGAFGQENKIYCSHANRAQQTISGIVDSLDINIDWITEPDLYTFDVSDILYFCQQLDDNDKCITIVGHNPALHETVEYLTGEHIEKFPTCAYAKLTCQISSWQELQCDCASLEAFLFPKML